MADSFEQLRLEFLAETEDTLQQLQQDLNELGQSIESGSVLEAVLDRVFRTTHSLKGVAGMFGLDLMSSVSHAMESVFESIRRGTVSLDRDLADLLHRGNEVLHLLLAAGSEGPETAEAGPAGAVIAALEAALAAREPDTPETRAVPGIVAQLDASERDAVRRAIAAGRRVVAVEATLPCEGFEEPFRELLEAIRTWGTVHGSVSGHPDADQDTFTVRVVASGAEEVFPLMKAVGPIGGEVLLGASASPGGEAPSAAAAAAAAAPDEDETPAPEAAPAAAAAGAAPPPPIPERAAGAAPRSPATRGGASLRVPVERVDRLLIRLGDLIQAKMGLDETAAALLDETRRVSPTMLRQSLRGLDRHIRALQDGILGVRLVELGPLFQKLERTFREACRATGKDARLVTEGEHLELDKGIVDAIAEPLIHLVRNAVDHGLEAPAVRALAGKEPRGLVAIRARTEGSHTILEVGDDGGGIDRDRVVARGIERGLVPEGATLSMAEARELLFQPGFSTKDAVTEISGRGVGLDAVREAMGRVGGSVEIAPSAAGTLFRMRVPVTLAVMQALEIVDGARSYFVPLPSVLRVLRPAPDDVDVVATDERVYLSGAEAIPLRELASLLDPAVPERRDEVRAGVVLAMGDRRLLLPVERVGRRREIVVRSLGPLLPSVPGIAGCTELGDGRTVLILDPIALFEAAGRSLAGAGA